MPCFTLMVFLFMEKMVVGPSSAEERWRFLLLVEGRLRGCHRARGGLQRTEFENAVRPHDASLRVGSPAGAQVDYPVVIFSYCGPFILVFNENFTKNEMEKINDIKEFQCDVVKESKSKGCCQPGP